MPAAFSVYIDPASTPASSQECPAVKPGATPLKRHFSLDSAISSLSSIGSLHSSQSSIGLVVNKENVDPLTGAIVSHGGDAAGKKRKNGVLAVKALPVTVSDACGDSKLPEAKKMKKSASTGKSAKASSSSSSTKRKTSSSSGRKPTRKSSRQRMPKVEERDEDAPEEEVIASTSDALTVVTTAEQVVQAQVDSKCKDLTVTPLADVSEAFETTRVLPAFLTETADDDYSPVREKTPFVRDTSTEPLFRDFAPTSEDVLKKSRSRSRSRARSAEPVLLTTPERKQIYSAFTFQSPSPTRKRKLEVASDDELA